VKKKNGNNTQHNINNYVSNRSGNWKSIKNFYEQSL
jgi:hypothetical protein